MMLKLSTKYTKLGSSTGPPLCQNQGGSEDSVGKQDTHTGIRTEDQTYVPTQFGLHKSFNFRILDLPYESSSTIFKGLPLVYWVVWAILETTWA